MQQFSLSSAKNLYPSFLYNADIFCMDNCQQKALHSFRGYPIPYPLQYGFETWSHEGTNVRIQPKRTKILSEDLIKHEEDKKSEDVRNTFRVLSVRFPWELGKELALETTGMGDLVLEVNAKPKNQYVKKAIRHIIHKQRSKSGLPNYLISAYQGDEVLQVGSPMSGIN